MPRCVHVFALLLVCLSAPDAVASDACDGTPADPARFAALVRDVFTYDTAAGLDVRIAGTRTAGPATIADVTFAARPGRPAERTAAFVVTPARPAPSLAGVLWVHWLGNPETTNRTEFLDEATALAGQGVVSVLVDTMWARPKWYRDRVLDEDYAHSVAQVVALRRALDLLLAQPGVDRTRVALVGHDYGAMYGAIVAGVDGRLKAQVSIAATASLLDWAFFYGKTPSSMERYRREHAALSICDHLAAAADRTSSLFQFAERDEYVTLARAQALFGAPAGPKQLPKQMIVYGGADHAMVAPPTIRIDRTAWLVRELALQPQPAASPPVARRPEPAFVLPAMTGLVEGIAFRPKTGDWLFGDVHERGVWRRDAQGRITRFTAPDDRLLGVFRLVVDEDRGALWIAMSALPQMARYTDPQKGVAGVAELDLATGAIRRVALVPLDGADHIVGDLVLAPDGAIYATDSASPVLWKLAPGGGTLEPFVRSDLFGSLQGITTAGDGVGLFLTDYRSGVVYVDTATKQARRLAGPAGAELRGIDTLLRTPDGTLLAIQNGTKTQRVLRLTVAPGATAIAAVENVGEDPAMKDATLGTLAGDAFVFIADGGWNLFEPKAPPPAPRGVPLLKISVPVR